MADAQREWEANHEEWEADCLAQPGSTPEQCQIPQPSLADYLGERDFTSSATASVTFAGYLVASRCSSPRPASSAPSSPRARSATG